MTHVIRHKPSKSSDDFSNLPLGFTGQNLLQTSQGLLPDSGVGMSEAK